MSIQVSAALADDELTLMWRLSVGQLEEDNKEADEQFDDQDERLRESASPSCSTSTIAPKLMKDRIVSKMHSCI